VRKPHGQQGEVAVFPLVENPGAVLVPKTEVFVLDAEQRVVAGPLAITRRRAYHREWLIGLRGVTRAVAETWREHLLGVEAADGDGRSETGWDGVR
jgi:hypothetical protein